MGVVGLGYLEKQSKRLGSPHLKCEVGQREYSQSKGAGLIFSRLNP